MPEQILVKSEDLRAVINEILTTPSKSFLTTKEAASYLRCSIVTFWKIRKSGEVNHVLVGQKMLFKKSELDKYLNKKEVSHV